MNEHTPKSAPSRDISPEMAFAREKWDGLRHRLGSRLKTLEVLAVLEGAKGLARILCKEDSVQETLQQVHSLGLSVVSSDFKLILEPSSSTPFTETSITADLHDSRSGHIVLYVSKNEKQAELGKHFEMKQDHSALGTLLGYPSCCCIFFEKHFSRKHTDLTFDTLETSEGFEFSFLTNIAARHIDVSLLSHFPCSFSCKNSIEIAKKLLAIAKAYGQEDVFHLCLQTAIVYSEDEGIIFLQHPIKNGNTVSYSNATCTKEGKLFYLLNNSNRMTITDKHSFLVGEDSVSGKHIGVMLFA